MTLTEIINALLGAVKRRKAELKKQADIVRSKKVAGNILEKFRSLNELEKLLTEVLPDDDEAPNEAEPAWKPTPEQMEALMLTIEGKAPAPTSYLSRRLEDLYEGLANTYGVECDLHNEENATKETFDNPISALADLCDKVEKYTRQETSRSILMNSLHAAQKLLAGK